MFWIFSAIFLNILGGLWLEAWAANQGLFWVEWAIGLGTFAHLGFYLAYLPSIGSASLSRRMLITCLLLATVGELVLSSVMGLYIYRESVLPLFVPPGHVLLFIAGICMVERFSASRIFTWLVCILVIFVASILALRIIEGRDTVSLYLFGAFLMCLCFGRERKLYGVMFLLALLLELLGTQLGAWRWSEHIPGTHLTAANPPLAAGAFYALLDLLVDKFRSLLEKTPAEVSVSTSV